MLIFDDKKLITRNTKHQKCDVFNILTAQLEFLYTQAIYYEFLNNKLLIFDDNYVYFRSKITEHQKRDILEFSLAKL